MANYSLINFLNFLSHIIIIHGNMHTTRTQHKNKNTTTFRRKHRITTSNKTQKKEKKKAKIKKNIKVLYEAKKQH